MDNKKRFITIIFIIAVVLLGIKGRGLLKSKQEEMKHQPLPKLPTITVDLGYAKQGSLINKVSYLATLQAQKSIKLSTKLAGFVKKVYVRESDSVKKGNLLLTIDAKELKANLEALKSTLKAQKNDLILAQKIYNRNKKLYKVGGISKEMLETSAVGVNMKKAVVEGTKQKIVGVENQLSYLDIKAPFDGKIDNILLHEGDLAATGKPILSMSSFDKKLVFSYALTKDTKLKKSLPVLYNGQTIGSIKTIYNTAQNGLATAEVALEKDLDIPLGSSMDIDVITKEKSGCIVSSDAILHRKDGDFIMIYKDNKFEPKKVDIEVEDGDSVLIATCPKEPYAKASEAKLAELPIYSKVKVVGAKDE